VGVERRNASHVAARTAVVWEVLRREIDRAAAGRAPLTVVDVGGGTGGFAVPIALAGHDVTVVDASPDALAALTRRAAEAGVATRIRGVQGDADTLADLVPAGSADLVLCHSVLEVVDSPAEVVAALAVGLRPGGAATTGGQLATATALLTDPEGRAGERDTLRRRFDVDGATSVLTKAGLTVEEIHGVRVVADLVPGSVQELDQEGLIAFELATAGRSPYRDIASQLHLLARR
jgi:S-adenosylmethionine-dependent methyltransferase